VWDVIWQASPLGHLWWDENEEMRLPCLAEGVAKETSEVCTAIGPVSDLCGSKMI